MSEPPEPSNAGAHHPGYQNYPPSHHRPSRLHDVPPLQPPAHTPTRRTPLPPLHPVSDAPEPDDRPQLPRKITVTRVVAMRSRQLTGRGLAVFHRAASANGADKSGLTALIYVTMLNFAVDAALGVALANTLFFSAATSESRTKVALYLLITIAPFAVVAPLIGPMLDRLQHGRRVALAASFGLRAALAVLLIFNFNGWGLYPVALAMMVLSKSFSVLKSAVTPRVLPPDIDLVRTNSRLTVFGLIGGTICAGATAGAIALLAGSTGVLWFLSALAVGGAILSLRIPSWVEITAGEVPTTITYRRRTRPSRRQPLGRAVVTGLWGNSTIRILTGFLTLFVAFVAKSRTEHDPVAQASMLGVVGAAAAIGNFSGNASGARLAFRRPTLVVLQCTVAATVVTVVAAITDNLLGAAIAALIASCASALAKVSLDAAIQDDLPPESIASGFGRSESVLQLSWVLGGAAGVLLPTEYWIGFTAIGGLLALGLLQTALSYSGRSLLPGLGGNRPVHADPPPHDDRSRTDSGVPAGHGTRVTHRPTGQPAT
ncbi:MFS transporter [Skermania piniformis]|uniref:MFS transporter n=1 Tax=Skermania pinensis TaxID=39122 RepID=UPI000A67E23F|nr:MFS transporter [Skermania piniformis]